jgi:multidrug efflux system outer membrane protein
MHQAVILLGTLGLGSCALPPGWDPVNGGFRSAVAQAGRTRTSISLPTDAAATLPATLPSAPQSPSELNGDVTLRRCVGVALEKNLSIKMAALQGRASTDAIDLAKSTFDPSIDLIGGTGEAGNNEGNAVIRKRFGTGTELRAEAGTLFLDNTDRTQGSTTNDADYILTLRQPLLQGASWKANHAPIEKARLLARDASENTRIQVYEMLRGIETAYWTASYAADLESSLRQSLARVRSVREIIEKRIAEGASTKLDSLEADAAVARAESALVNARKTRQDSLDQLWYVMGYEPLPPDEVELTALGAASVDPADVDASAHYAKARAQAPEVILLANDIRARELNVTVARDRALPKVYAELNWGSSEFISGSSSSSSSSTSSTSTSAANASPDNAWAALLRVSIPWTFRAERAQLDIARSDLARSTVARENGMRLLQKSISETCRAVSAAHQKLEAASRGAEANRTKFAEQQLRYQTGLASARDVMEAETELRQAESIELEDRLQLVLASILLSREDGTILERHGLVL